MNIKIKYRKSLCDNCYFYELYINNYRICGYYSFEMIQRRLKFILDTGRFNLEGIYLYEKFHKEFGNFKRGY